MGILQKFSVLFALITLSACNEKISPALEQSGSTGPDEGGSSGAYSFSVKNTSNLILNYMLHKTGPGNFKKPCEIRRSTPFSTNAFSADREANDITCFFEAEELTLYSGGFEFTIDAGENSCDYIGYSPFGFYDDIPGDSTATYFKVSCANSETNSNEVLEEIIDNADIPSGLSDFLDGGDLPNDQINCNDMIISSNDIPSGREHFPYTSDQDLCRFNYEKKKCDVGVVTIKDVKFTFIEGDPLADPVKDPVYKVDVSTKTVNCGGAVMNCVEGPIKSLTKDLPRQVFITPAKPNEKLFVKHSYPALIGNKNPAGNLYNSVKSYANYRRNLASKYIDFGNSLPIFQDEDDFDEENEYIQIWSKNDIDFPYIENNYHKIFTPELLERYSNNLPMNDSTPLIDEDVLNDAAISSNMYKAVPFVAEPYLGLKISGQGDFRVNPFYTFFCLDRTYDVKARIRMMVREWDRPFSTNSHLELLTDLTTPDLFDNDNSCSPRERGRQDTLPHSKEFCGYDGIERFNDFEDWDDHIPMMRESGEFDDGLKIWGPIAPNGDPDAPPPGPQWFDRRYFTQGNF